MTFPTISGLQIRYVASSLTGAAGASVSLWSDASGNGNDASQATAAKQPVLGSVTIGSSSYQTVEFDGVDDFLAVNSATGTTSGTFLVVQVPRSTTTGAVMGSTSGGFEFRTEASTNTVRLIVQQVGTLISGSFASLSVGTASLSAVDYTTTSGNVYGNGTNVSTLSSLAHTVSSLKPLYIGAGQSAFEPLQFGALEILYFNRVLTTTERAQVDTYVQDTYGITVADYIAPSGSPLLNVGSTAPSAMYVGTSTVSAVYAGTTQVWP